MYCQYVCSLGIEPTTFALLTQCSTSEPQEHLFMYMCSVEQTNLDCTFSFIHDFILFFIFSFFVSLYLSFHDLFQCLFCEGDCNLPLPLQSADLFHMALVPACCSLISHTLAPHLALLLNMLFLHKMVPPFFQFRRGLLVSFHHVGEE